MNAPTPPLPPAVYFIGAGPGAPDLITVRALRTLERCPVWIYAGSLIPPAFLSRAPAGTALVDSQHLTLEEIVSRIASAYGEGKAVARLHSGDLSLYSALREQAERLERLGIPWEVVPGVPAFAAAAAALKRELTVPGLCQTVILGRYSKRATPVPPAEELRELGRHRATLVVHLGGHALAEIVGQLLPAYGPRCPAAVVAFASWPQEVVVEAPLGEVAQVAAKAGVRRNALLLVGRVLGGEPALRTHLYSKARQVGLADGV